MAEPDWRQERKSGIAAIAGSIAISAIIWVALWQLLPPLAGMESVAERMLVALNRERSLRVS